VKPAPTAVVCAHVGVRAITRPNAIDIHPTVDFFIGNSLIIFNLLVYDTKRVAYR